GFKSRLVPIDKRSLNLVSILVEEAEAENAQSVRVGAQLLYNQVVIFTRFNKSTIFTQNVANFLETITIRIFQSLDPGNSATTAFHRQFHESISCTGTGGWAKDTDFGCREGFVDIGPVDIGIIYQRFAAIGVRHFLGQRKKDLLA